MTALTVALCAAGWIVALALAAVLPARLQRRSLRRALRLRSSARPYLRRRALEANLEVRDAPGATPEAIIDDICELAEALTEKERAAAGQTDTVNTLAVSDTQPMVTPDKPIVR